MVASSSSDSLADAPAGCLLLECDGAVLDMHMDGHRIAYNRAFVDLGYDVRGVTCTVT
jgi:hypothetical protein